MTIRTAAAAEVHFTGQLRGPQSGGQAIGRSEIGLRLPIAFRGTARAAAGEAPRHERSHIHRSGWLSRCLRVENGEGFGVTPVFDEDLGVENPKPPLPARVFVRVGALPPLFGMRSRGFEITPQQFCGTRLLEFLQGTPLRAGSETQDAEQGERLQ